MHKLLATLLVLVFVVSGCNASGSPAAPLPTRTPLPTFTPTPPVVATPVDPAVAATAQAEAAAAAQQPAPPPPAAEGSAPAPVEPAPTDTPAAATPSVTINSTMNVRGGPGTGYNIVGQAAQGSRYDVTGKNPAGNWYQINFNGQAGWVFADLVTAQAVESVAVAANIPAPPPPAAAPRPPAATPVPPPAAPPAAPPAPRYEFNVAVVGECLRQPAGTWFEGTVYKGGQPVNGNRVVFSYAADGPWATSAITAGPHEGYSNWNPGYYSHIISAAGPVPGTWFVWIVDAAGNRISEIGSWTSTGPGEGCNMTFVSFDSR